jgi:hypothetical protein
VPERSPEPESELPTGETLLHRWDEDLSPEHRRVAGTCPGCGTSLLDVEIIDVAYAFRECGCNERDYEHLVEQLWHLACLQERQPDIDRVARELLDALSKHWHVGDAIVKLRMALRERSS